jgi:hypothetical protein
VLIHTCDSFYWVFECGSCLLIECCGLVVWKHIQIKVVWSDLDDVVISMGINTSVLSVVAQLGMQVDQSICHSLIVLRNQTIVRVSWWAT